MNKAIIPVVPVETYDREMFIQAIEDRDPFVWWLMDIWSLFQGKNEDYQETWMQYRPTSHTDVMLGKIHRIIQFEQKGSLNNEGAMDSLKDLVVYAYFRAAYILAKVDGNKPLIKAA